MIRAQAEAYLVMAIHDAGCQGSDTSITLNV